MNFTKIFLVLLLLISGQAFGQMQFVFQYDPGTMTGTRPGPWTKFQDPAVQNFWINGQRGYVLSPQEIAVVKEQLDSSIAIGNISVGVKKEIDKLIQYFSADNTEREVIKDFLPQDIRPMPLPASVRGEAIDRTLNPLWESVNSGDVRNAAKALEEVNSRLKDLSLSERDYAKSEMMRLFTYPSGQLKNLPHLPTSPVTFNTSINSPKLRPYVRALNEIHAKEASVLKDLGERKTPGAQIRRLNAKLEAERIERALRVEEFQDHYFNRRSDFAQRVANSSDSTTDAQLAEEAMEIIRSHPRISENFPESKLTPSEEAFKETAELSRCLEAGSTCKVRDSVEGSPELKSTHEKLRTLYESRVKSEAITDKEVKDISQSLIHFGHARVLNDDPDRDFYVKLAAEATDIGLGFIPGVGTAKDLVEFITGKSLLTGEKLDILSRSIMATAVVIDLASFGAGGRVAKAALEGAEASIKSFARTQVIRNWEEIEKFSQSVLTRISILNFTDPVLAKSYAYLHRALEAAPSNLKILRVRSGVDPQKVAVIGRKMENGVNILAKHLDESGVRVETFAWSEAAENEIKELLRNSKERIPYDEIIKTKAYAENKEWAERIRDLGYNIFDIGDPTGANVSEGFSAFYDIEQLTIWGDIIR